MTTMFPSNLISINYTSKRQTFIIPLTFSDINDVRPIIERISYGGDIWELRVDLLVETTLTNKSLTSKNDGKSTNLPSPAYVESQVKALQSISPLPILFTIRTLSQGGRFPDDAVDDALELMSVGVDCGIEYLDVEIEWPARLIERIRARTKSRGTKIVASYHSWTGTVPWSLEAGSVIQEKFRAADAFGDIIKLSILSPALEDTYELGLFVRAHNQAQPEPKPLLAVGMGRHGQLSRITSPISLVTHPLIPFPSAPGQLSLAQVHQAQYLMGILERRVIRITGEEARVEMVKKALEVAFSELGFPHVCVVGGEGEKGVETEGALTVSVREGEDLVEIVKEGFDRATGRRVPVSVIKEVLA